MESWDDENFEPKVAMPATIASNKWEGEDEDDNVKDNWEDEDEEKKEEPPKQAQEKPKKKTMQEKIAEKQKLKAEEEAKQQQEEEEQEAEDISPEERLRRQKESDLNVALETTFGGDSNTTTVGSNSTTAGIDGMDPKTKEDFVEFADAIIGKVQPYTKSTEFPVFAETVVRNICATMSSFDIKKIKNTIDNLYVEKQKIEKGDKMKKSKAKGKAKLKMDNENQYSAYVEDYDEFDDFM